MKDLIAENKQAYVAKAVNLASDRKRIRFLRKGLRKRLLSSELCNRVHFARKLEHCYRQKWIQWCQEREIEEP